MRIRKILWGAALLALAAPLGCGGGANETDGKSKKITLTFPHVLKTDHPVHKAIEKFKAEVEARSQGAIEVKVFGGGTIGDEPQLIDNVARGTYDITKVSSTVLETKTELAKVYSLPYLFRDQDHVWKVLEGEIGVELLDMALDKNLKGLCYLDAGARSFYTRKQIKTPADLKGVNIRVQKSVMMQKLVSALGALPQQISFSELYTALDTGTVDGAENNIPSYFTEQHYKVAPFYTFDEHVCLPDMVFINAKRWEGLTEDQKKIVTESLKVAADFERDLWKTANLEHVEKMKAAGVTFYRPDKEPFVEACKSIYDEFKGTEIDKYVERIRAVQ